MKHKRAGFTLIEIALVAAVLGLLIGGILLGTEVIHNAKLQSVIADVGEYKKTVQLFKDKYKALPGDMPTATTIWGAAAGCPDIAATDTPATATCNGAGDGYIGTAAGLPSAIGTDYQEHFRVWQHMANAGLLSERYTGTLSAATGELRGGVNVPASALTDNIFTMFYAGQTIGDASYFDANYRHILVFGKPSGVAGGSGPSYGLGFNTMDAFQIDSKMDDGKAGMGSVLTYKPVFMSSLAITLDTCTNGSDASTATYATDSDQSVKLCSLIFITGF